MPGSEPVVRKDSRLFVELCSALLRRGRSVRFRVHGESMKPNLRDGDLATVAPALPHDLRHGDIALTQNDSRLLLHRVHSSSSTSDTFHTKSDTGLASDGVPDRLFGRVTHTRRSAKEHRLTAWQNRCVHPARLLLSRIYAAASLRLSRISLRFFGSSALLIVASLLFASAAHAQADLQLTQTVSATAVAAGSNYTYTEVVTNNSTANAIPTGTMLVYLQTPPNTTFQGYTGTNWSCTNPGAGNAGPVICTYNAALAASSTATSLTVTVNINTGTAAGTVIQGSATVTSSTVDPVPSNNTSITNIIVEPTNTSDLGLTMSVSPTPVFIESNFAYTIQVQNYGQATAPVTANVLSDTLPAGVTFVSVVSSSGWSCAGTPTISCSITSPMAMGAIATITITVTAPASAVTLTNTATVALAGDPNTSNNSASSYTVVQPIVCATPGKDGAGGTLTGVVNAYYPPSKTGNLASGSTSVALGAVSGASVAIAAGDLLLIIQMQDATINSTNTSSYGSGLPGLGYGSTNLASSGLFEFVTATSAVPVGGGTLDFEGSGSGGGLLNTYTYNPYNTTTGAGQQTYQVIRVPQYTSATLSSGLVPLAWNGSVGGVLAIDVSSQLTLGGTVAADRLGFRGGGGRDLGGGTGADTDYVTLSTDNTNGSKGEGIAGTPRYLAPATITVTTTPTNTGVEGLPNGSYARGAPGNAGGGGTDGDPAANSYNSGGGAGGNGGAGGYGGYGWNSFVSLNTTDGGFGGAAFPASTSALVMGGAGGAGTTNDGSYYISSTNYNQDCGADCTGIYSSGAPGGGIVIVHTGSVVGTGTITSNGGNGLSTTKDSTGGAGAGGSILFFANTGTLGGLTVSAVGGSAGNAWQLEAPGGFPGERHGPGGGGGGGVIFLTSTPASYSVLGGSNGFTDTVQDSYGSTPGQPGVVVTTDFITETPGTQAGAYCASADLSVTNSGSPAVVAPGGTITYTQTVANAGPFDAVNAVFSESIPANTTFQSINNLGGWTCSTPGPGGTGTITCTNPDFASGGSGTFTVVVNVSGTAPTGTEIIDVDNITSGTTDPNLANNSATVVTTVGSSTQADLAVSMTASSPTVLVGGTVTMAAVVTNNGPAAASTAVFTEAIPTNTTLGQAFTPPAGWTCNTIPVGGTGTLTCVDNSFAATGVAQFNVVLQVVAGTASGTVISDTATIGASTPDPNYDNNSATATTVVAASGQADLAVSSSGAPNPVTPGNNITYKQSITNNGPTAITAGTGTTVTFTDTIPTNTTLASAFTAPTGWTCNTIAVGGTGTFTCTLNAGQTLGVGAVVNFPLAVKVNFTTSSGASTVGTTITNTPSISSSVSDPNLANNTTTVSTLVASPNQSDVTITKSASPDPVDQGTNLTYTITVTNNGPATAQGVDVIDPIQAQVTYSSASATQGTCSYSSSTTTVTCSLGSLGVGSVAVVTINVSATVFGSSAVTCNGVTNTYTTCNGAYLTSTTSNPNTSACSGSTLPTPNACAGSIIQYSTAVDLASMYAFSQPDGSVRLVWHTLEESRNLGFHIYREDASGRHRVDNSLIAGSALILRGSRPQHAAKWYAWVDSQPAPNASYWIEDVDVNGTRTTHGPVYPQLASNRDSQTQSVARSTAALSVAPSLNQLHSNAPLANQNLVRRLIMPIPILPPPPPKAPPVNVVDQSAVQISVDQIGWYHLPFSQLFAAGLDPGTDVRLLHLYAEGVEQPILLTGHQSGVPSPSDAIEFYGTPINTPFSGTRVYWLVRDNWYSKRIGPAPVTSPAGVAPVSFPYTAIREDHTTYFAALLNGVNNDNFFGDVVTSEPVDETLTVIHRDAASSQPLTLVLTLQGVTDQQQHSVDVQVNGTDLGTFNFYGEILASQTFSVDPSLVVDGTNNVTLTALDGDNDVSLVQSVQLQYLHTYTADSDWLQATANSGEPVQISGFANSVVRLFDITDPLNITELDGKVSAESGTYTISAPIPPGAPYTRTLLSFSQDQLSAPLALNSYTPSSLESQRAGADIVIITHPDFASQLAPLVNLRSSQGYKVLQVTTDELYDVFNFGEHSPFAIQTFLEQAVAHWQRKPQAVLFVGDGSMDPRNYLGFGDFDFVPTRMIETAALKTASDDWFTDFNQTGYPTIPTGRLPVRTAAEADLLVSKIVGYEQGQSAGSWNSQALLIADQNVDANFSAAVTAAAAVLPKSLQTTQILTDGLDLSTAQTEIMDALNNGALLVDYNGHGAEQQWSFSDLFDDGSAAALTNGGRLPVYLLIDCLNGLFQDVYAESLSKALILAPNGGAVAVWASSGFTSEPPQASMDLALLNEFATHPNEMIGLMILRAKRVTTDSDVRRTWILFGDPAMKFHFATSPTHTTPGTQPHSPTPIHFPRPCPPKASCPLENQQ